jgi:hypothetical protein
MEWVKQGGGMSCTQHTLEGRLLPLGQLVYLLDYPDWLPQECDDINEALADMPVEEIPESDHDLIPDYIHERGHFSDHDEYHYWIEEKSDRYGSTTLWDELYRFTYGIFDLLESDPRERWDSTDALWEEIEKSLPFTFEFLEWEDWTRTSIDKDVYDDDSKDVIMDFDVSAYPKHQSAIRWIRITGSKVTSRGNLSAPWAEEIKGEVCFLLCPNAD